MHVCPLPIYSACDGQRCKHWLLVQPSTIYPSLFFPCNLSILYWHVGALHRIDAPHMARHFQLQVQVLTHIRKKINKYNKRLLTITH